MKLINYRKFILLQNLSYMNKIIKEIIYVRGKWPGIHGFINYKN